MPTVATGNVAAKLAAGTTVGFDATTPDTFVLIEGIESLGAVGDVAEAKEKTTLADVRKTYGTGMVDSPDMEISGIYLPKDTNQKAFVDACKAKKEFQLQISWPDGTVGKFKFQPFGFTIAETSSGEWIKFTITGKQNTNVTWTTTV